jgi:hypothetical protein
MLDDDGLSSLRCARRMRRSLIVSMVIVAGVLAQHAEVLHACGEKLLALGRGIRFQSRHSPRPASVLLYLPQSASPLTDPNLESALKDAGHAVRAATTTADLESALRSGSYDVVLANVTDAPDLERAQAVTAANAVVLPAVYLVTPAAQKQTKADRDSASKTFGVMVEVPGRPGHYCAAVDKAMELKLKRDKANARHP